MSGLRNLITPEAIRLDVTAKTWREAIRAAGQLLTDSAAAGQSYTEAMITVVEEHGPYIVIAPGFALAHARPDDSVKSTAMSFIRLKDPVMFGHSSNDPVRLVVALSAKDSDAHRQALASLASLLGDQGRRRVLEHSASTQEVLDVLTTPPGQSHSHRAEDAEESRSVRSPQDLEQEATGSAETVPSKKLILTVCGNGLGTSLFLKNTADQVLERWGWSPYLRVEATDTISAKGRAGEADFLLTSEAIAQTLGDVGVPVEVIENFTSQEEIDAVLRRLYDV